MGERRKYPRTSEKTGTPVSFVVENDHGNGEYEGSLVDHSAGGLQIITDSDDVRVGMEIYIKVRAGNPPVDREVAGKVVWLTNSSREKRMGMEYIYPLYGIPYFF